LAYEVTRDYDRDVKRQDRRRYALALDQAGWRSIRGIRKRRGM